MISNELFQRCGLIDANSVSSRPEFTVAQRHWGWLIVALCGLVSLFLSPSQCQELKPMEIDQFPQFHQANTNQERPMLPLPQEPAHSMVTSTTIDLGYQVTLVPLSGEPGRYRMLLSLPEAINEIELSSTDPSSERGFTVRINEKRSVMGEISLTQPAQIKDSEPNRRWYANANYPQGAHSPLQSEVSRGHLPGSLNGGFLRNPYYSSGAKTKPVVDDFHLHLTAPNYEIESHRKSLGRVSLESDFRSTGYEAFASFEKIVPDRGAQVSAPEAPASTAHSAPITLRFTDSLSDSFSDETRVR